jgi:hypothetical protein
LLVLNDQYTKISVTSWLGSWMWIWAEGCRHRTLLPHKRLHDATMSPSTTTTSTCKIDHLKYKPKEHPAAASTACRTHEEWNRLTHEECHGCTVFPCREIIKHLVCNKMRQSFYPFSIQRYHRTHSVQQTSNFYLTWQRGRRRWRGWKRVHSVALEVKDEAQADLKNPGIQITVIYATTSPCLDD